jgi:hypothetical protein
VTRALLHTALAAVVFIGITFFEQIPILGWFGGVISVAAWIWLTRRLLSDSEGDVIRSGIGVGWAAVLGALSGFVGALTAWLAQTGNLFGFETPPGDRFGAIFGFLGASLGILYWPVIGALVCGGVAVAITGRLVGVLRRTPDDAYGGDRRIPSDESNRRELGRR